MVAGAAGREGVAPKLAGRRALITGAGSGIGRATALRLAADGAGIAAVDVDLDAAAKVADEATALGVGALALSADVGDEAAVRDAVSAAVGHLGGLDTVVAAAGITRAGRTDETTLDAWNLIIRINLTGVFLTLKHALPHLCAADGGAIVTIGSVASLVAAGRSSSYDASKGGVLQLTRAVAVEYADRGVRANCVCPGVVATNLAANSQTIAGPLDAARGDNPQLRVSVPMARHADPAEIAGAVAFLCSDDASFITGAAIAADGGFTAV
ncbi:short-chain dehydrogenase/reductase SDR [Parafrankia sp. EAN1pec]|uniref:SDR family NAD(P)-dependent oxidoreductase n=1 Tax=Parafrankia sp. (strain EAN1pec) TaxID=298653 RepID=UPI0000541ABB|nr:short-chain dehydrogenase/reductase SDR [Frankia sp. EAN1pec]